MKLSLKVPEVFRRPYRGDRPLAVQRIDGHFLVTAGGTWGWYRLSEARWAYRSVEDHQALLDRVAYAYSSIAGRAFRLRLSHRPVSSLKFATSLDVSTIDPLPGDDWARYVEACRDRIDEIGLTETIPVIGVRLGDRTDNPLDLADENAEVIGALSASGLGARPLGTEDMEWLMHRSAAPGIPLPPAGAAGCSVWADDPGVSFTDAVELEAAPFDRAVRVRAWRDGREVEAWAVTLTVGRMADRRFPEDGSAPWLAAAARQPFEVDVTVSGRVHRGRDLADKADLNRRYAEDNLDHYVEVGEKPPPSLHRTVERAGEVHDQMTSGDRVNSARVVLVARLTVTGATRDEAIARARRLTRSFGEDVRVELEWTRDQVAALRELIPGEPWAKWGYQRQMPLRYLAAAVPNMTGRVGTPVGHFLGYTSGDAPGRMVLHDSHYAQEVLDRSGLIPVLGSLGAGKSGLLARVLYGMTLGGVASFALDPSGPLANLCYMPELKPFARHLDLTSAAPGTLDPRRLLVIPRREDFEDEGVWLSEKGRVEAQRNSLLIDVLTMLLPPVLTAREDTILAVDAAVTATGADPWATVQHLRDHNHEGLANKIEGAAKGYARLLFPDPDHPVVDDDLDKATLVVVTMSGLKLPDAGAEKADWSEEERVSAAVLHLAAFCARRFVALRPRAERKVITLDEVSWLARWPSGRSFVAQFIRDTRKFNIALYAGAQHPRDVRKLDPEGEAFTGGGFIGRQDRADVAGECLDLFGLPGDAGYRAVITSLCKTLDEAGNPTEIPGEFLHVDALGDTERMRVDFKDMLPGLFEAADTTPGSRR